MGTPGVRVACLGLALTLPPWCAYDSALGSRKFKSVLELDRGGEWGGAIKAGPNTVGTWAKS